MALIVTVVALAVCAVYASAATMWAFGRLSPDITNRVIARSKEQQTEARLQRSAALMASRRRGSIVAAWKLARLKRAAFAFAVAGVLVALAAVVGEAIAGG